MESLQLLPTCKDQGSQAQLSIQQIHFLLYPQTISLFLVMLISIQFLAKEPVGSAWLAQGETLSGFPGF